MFTLKLQIYTCNSWFLYTLCVQTLWWVLIYVRLYVPCDCLKTSDAKRCTIVSSPVLYRVINCHCAYRLYWPEKWRQCERCQINRNIILFFPGCLNSLLHLWYGFQCLIFFSFLGSGGSREYPFHCGKLERGGGGVLPLIIAEYMFHGSINHLWKKEIG